MFAGFRSRSFLSFTVPSRLCVVLAALLLATVYSLTFRLPIFCRVHHAQQLVHGPVDYRHTYVDMQNVTVNGNFSHSGMRFAFLLFARSRQNLGGVTGVAVVRLQPSSAL